MHLAIDIGNSNIKIGVVDEFHIIQYARFATDIRKTADEYGLQLINVLSYTGVQQEKIDGIIIASVVPSINYTIEHMCDTFFRIEPLIVGPGTKTGMNILYNDPKEVGADRITTAVGAYHKAKGACIVIDFGTATTFSAVSGNGDFLGGAIMPGIKLSMEALVTNAAKLPRIELAKPEAVIAKNTVENMQSGIINGFVGAVGNIIDLMKQEMGGKPYVIATGGLSRLIAPSTPAIDEIDNRLSMRGLNYIYQKNKDLRG